MTEALPEFEAEIPFARPAPLSPATSCAAVYNMFSSATAPRALAVVEDEVPVGLVSRMGFLTLFARRYVNELYGRKPITMVMDAAPIVVPVEAGVEAVSRLIADNQARAAYSGWILTRDGRYAGIGDTVGLLRRWIAEMDRRNRDLQRMRDEAARANQAKSQFLANMSHELRTPLNAIIGFSEVMTREHLGPIGSAKYREYIADIGRSGHHLLALINEVLDLAKVEAGSMALHPEAVDAAVLIDECRNLLAGQAQNGGLALRPQVAPDLPMLWADPLRLRQVLINLVSNAVKFTPAGGEVVCGARCGADGGIVLWVKDTGIGMSEDQLAHAMQPFQQVESHLTRRHGGTGLGLPLAKLLTELHGGTLSVHTSPGGGTLIDVALPAARTLPRGAAVA
jgi:two-component system cell cycle sensor histidine kinase PleC